MPTPPTFVDRRIPLANSLGRPRRSVNRLPPVGGDVNDNHAPDVSLVGRWLVGRPTYLVIWTVHLVSKLVIHLLGELVGGHLL